jgi:hypothetical protein
MPVIHVLNFLRYERFRTISIEFNRVIILLMMDFAFYRAMPRATNFASRLMSHSYKDTAQICRKCLRS